MASREQPPAGHDACGVGFIAHIRGQPGRDIVSLGLNALRRLTHRGAAAALGAVDGCGVLTAIPWPYLEQAFAGRLPAAPVRALGVMLVHPSDRLRAAALVERELPKAGAPPVAQRLSPPARAAPVPAPRHSDPNARQ